jgi:DNA-binding NarL/FixJ family response regulator
METIRIVIADDHPVFRYGLRALLRAEPDMDIVGEATTGAEAISLATTAQPNVILLDLNMPDVNGIEATRQIVRLAPEVAILVITMVDEDESLFAAMRAGARGYLLKGAEGDETVRAVRAVSHGEAIFSPAIARRLMQYFGAPPPAASPRVFPQLSDRELELLDLLARGYTNAAIAEQLVISPRTVRNHVSHIFAKLQVAGRAEAVVRARESGLGT